MPLSKKPEGLTGECMGSHTIFSGTQHFFVQNCHVLIKFSLKKWKLSQKNSKFKEKNIFTKIWAQKEIKVKKIMCKKKLGIKIWAEKLIGQRKFSGYWDRTNEEQRTPRKMLVWHMSLRQLSSNVKSECLTVCYRGFMIRELFVGELEKMRYPWMKNKTS